MTGERSDYDPPELASRPTLSSHVHDEVGVALQRQRHVRERLEPEVEVRPIRAREVNECVDQVRDQTEEHRKEVQQRLYLYAVQLLVQPLLSRQIDAMEGLGTQRHPPHAEVRV